MTPTAALLFLLAIILLALLMLAVLVASDRRAQRQRHRVNRWTRERPAGISLLPAGAVANKQGSSLSRGTDSMGASACATIAGKSPETFAGIVQCRK